MKFAVFFPGIGYHCDKPLLYYSRKMASELGYETLALAYSYDGGNIRGNKEKMKDAFEDLYARADESLKDISFTDYDDILFVSKSVGTIIASAYAYNHGIKCKQVLYTPLEYTFDYPLDKACAFIGTADPWSEVFQVVDTARLKKIPIFVYAKLNHSLEGDDYIKNISVLEKVMKQTYEFLTRPDQAERPKQELSFEDWSDAIKTHILQDEKYLRVGYDFARVEVDMRDKFTQREIKLYYEEGRSPKEIADMWDIVTF